MTLQSTGGTRATVEAARRVIHEHDGARSGRETRRNAGVQNCSGTELRRVGFIFGNHGQPGAGGLLRHAGGASAARPFWPKPPRSSARSICWSGARATGRSPRSCWDASRCYKEYLRRFGGSFDDNPTPGNKEGGLTNIIEKSLGAVAKAGTSPLMDVVDYAERIDSPGFVFMNTPGYDPVSLTGLGRRAAST